MASAGLRKELECSVCLNIYTDPVMLECGHNFCRDCIGRFLDTQERSGGYSCPECREEFQERPALYRNITLRNIVENFLSTQPGNETPEVLCTYCVDSPVPAVKSCLLCEASLCDNHLRVHSKAPEHVLCDPTTSLESRKCSVHKKILEYYCSVDGACICMACRLDGAHHGHRVKMLAAASITRKEKLKTVQQKLMMKQKEAEKRIHRLHEHRGKVLEKADGEKTKITVLLGDLRRRLEDLERRVLREVTGQAQQISRSVTDMIRELEVKKDEMSRKIHHIEELCHMTDPLTVLQESDTGDLCDTEDGHDEGTHDDGGGLDVAGMVHTLRTGISDILSLVREGLEEAEDISLDVNTAGRKLQISHGMITALPSPDDNLPQTPQRFKHSMVASRQSFSSGRHTWEVDVGGSRSWDFGLCYSSVDRSWNPEICYRDSRRDRKEYMTTYWALHFHNGSYGVLCGDMKSYCPLGGSSSKRIRMYLDYEAGRISFYELSCPIKPLHTFTTTFTKPLHVVIGVWEDYGCIKLCGREGVIHVQ